MKIYNETHEWRDTIHCWGDDLLVTNVISTNNNIRLYYKDIDGQKKHIEGATSSEYISGKRKR
jgi:hypothetical protein